MGSRSVGTGQGGDLARADAHQQRRSLFHRQVPGDAARRLYAHRSEEHTSELQSLMRISYAVFCLKNNKQTQARHLSNKALSNKPTISDKNTHIPSYIQHTNKHTLN